MFLRGLGGNAAQLGHQQNDAIRNITGMVWARGIEYQANGFNGVFYVTPSPDNVSFGHKEGRGAQINFDVARCGLPTAEENRPVNCAVNYCIKY
jgi:hypothetical protein